LRCPNRIKPTWVKDWILGELRAKHTRTEFAWWLNPKDREQKPIDGTWCLAQKFTIATGPTVVSETETENEEEYLLEYLLGIYAPGKEKKAVTQINMYLIFQSTCTAQLPVIDIPIIIDEEENAEGREKKKANRKLATKKNTSTGPSQTRTQDVTSDAQSAKKVCLAQS
jgi:hypothetical protein